MILFFVFFFFLVPFLQPPLFSRWVGSRLLKPRYLGTLKEISSLSVLQPLPCLALPCLMDLPPSLPLPSAAHQRYSRERERESRSGAKTSPTNRENGRFPRNTSTLRTERGGGGRRKLEESVCSALYQSAFFSLLQPALGNSGGLSCVCETLPNARHKRRLVEEFAVGTCGKMGKGSLSSLYRCDSERFPKRQVSRWYFNQDL